MTTSNLINKLNKMNVTNKVIDINSYNKDVVFVINNITFHAGFNADKNIVIDYHTNICYDNCNQETERRFFDNLNQILRYAARN